MASLIKMNFDKPEEVRPFGESSGKLELVNLAAGPVGRATFEPGWKWSEHIKPIVKTDSCQLHHVGLAQSGSITVRAADGTEAVISAGTVYVIEPGHDAWVNGNEPFVAYEFDSHAAKTFAK